MKTLKFGILFVTLTQAQAVSAQFWDATETATADAFVGNSTVAQYVKQPTSWCHYQARNSFPNFYVGLGYPGGPSSCQDFPANPPELLEVTADLLSDRDGLEALGCASVLPTTVYLAEYLGGIRGLTHRLYPDHIALEYGDPDDERARATRAHEIAHLSHGADLGGAQVANKWYAEALAVLAERQLHPGNMRHIRAHVPWPLYWSWGLNTGPNPHNRYHLGIFLEYVANRFGFDACRWLQMHTDVLAAGDRYPVWESLAVELGGRVGSNERLREVWADFVHDMGLRKIAHTPSMVELPVPGITVYPQGGFVAMDYNLSGSKDGDIWQIEVPPDGRLHFQWQSSTRCGGYPGEISYVTLQDMSGARLGHFRFGGELGEYTFTGLTPGPITVSVSSLEGTEYLAELYVNAQLGWIVSTAISDPYAEAMRALDPWPHWAVVQTQYGPQEQCVPGAGELQ